MALPLQRLPKPADVARSEALAATMDLIALETAPRASEPRFGMSDLETQDRERFLGFD